MDYKCKYCKSGWCYAPTDANKNDADGQCKQPLGCKERERQVDQLIIAKG